MGTQPFIVTPEQRRQLRKDLVEALRSGKFEQGQGKMCEDDRHCCLGVACRVFDENLPGILKIECDAGGTTRFDGCADLLPGRVRKAFGLATPSGRHSEGSLVQMNDKGATFPEIADFIESNPPGLWVDEPEVSHA